MEESRLVRNTILLALSMTALSIMTQLNAAFGAVTFVSVGGSGELVGMAPAFTFVTVAIGALLAGTAMDRFGRVPVLATGFGLGVVGALLAHHAAAERSVLLLLIALVLLGLAQGTGMLSRVAAADMYPAHRRAIGMAIVLMGAVIGALMGPLIFAPMLHGSALGLDGLPDAWLAAAIAMAAGFVLIVVVRPDPSRARPALAAPGARATSAKEPLAPAMRRSSVRSALVAATASYAVMVAMMGLTGHLALGKGQDASDVLEAVAAHITGMFAFGLGVGFLIDRDGPRRWLVVGLILLAASALVLALSESALVMAASMFTLGIGWSFAFIGASTALVGQASPTQRGRILGVSDLLSGLAGAALALLGGVVAQTLGSVALGVGMAVVALSPIPFLLRDVPPSRAALPGAQDTR